MGYRSSCDFSLFQVHSSCQPTENHSGNIIAVWWNKKPKIKFSGQEREKSTKDKRISGQLSTVYHTELDFSQREGKKTSNFMTMPKDLFFGVERDKEIQVKMAQSPLLSLCTFSLEKLSGTPWAIWNNHQLGHYFSFYSSAYPHNKSNKNTPRSRLVPASGTIWTAGGWIHNFIDK